MTRQFVLQMAGHPGSGKSSVARAIAEATDAIVVDKDMVKTPLVEAHLNEEIAGSLSYQIVASIGADLLAQNKSIILDSPAYFPEILADGKRIAAEAGAAYLLIECECQDRDELERRLKERDAMPSQIDFIVDDPFERDGTEPLSEPHLVLDTSQDMEAAVAEALRYLEERAGD